MNTELATYGLGNSEYLYPLHTQYFLLDRPTLAIITYVLGQVAIPLFYFTDKYVFTICICNYLDGYSY